MRSGGLGLAWRERLARPGWTRTVYARRFVAAGLVLMAGALALRGDPGRHSVDVVVASQDLPPGHVLTIEDVRTAPIPSAVVASGASSEVGAVTGRSLAGAVRAGEQLTDVRVVGASLAAAATGRRDAVAVPVRLTDPEVAGLLRPGDTVDVLALGKQAGQVDVVAQDATVLTVATGDAPRGSAGRLVVLGVVADAAPAVAAASLESVVTVTLR